MTASKPTDRTLLSNAGSLYGARLGIAAMGWAGTVLIVQTLSEEQWGQFAFVFGLLGMLAIITDMGTGRVAISGVLDETRDREEFAGAYIVLRTILGFVGYAIAVGFAIVGGYPSEVIRAVAIAGVTVLLSTPSNAHQIAFQAHLRMNTVAISGLLGQAAQLAVTIGIALRGGTLLWFLIPPIAAELVMLGYKVPRARAMIGFRYCIRPRIWAALLREAAPLSIGGALLGMTYRVDTIMLSKLDSFESVGAYGVAYKFADLAKFAATAITVPLLTMLTRAWGRDPAAYRAALGQGAMYLSVIGGGFIVGFSLFAGDIIALLFTETYRVAAQAATILIAATALLYFTSLAFNALVAAGRNRWYPVVTLTGLIVNVGLNLWLIPRMSFDGAAAATLVTEVIIATSLWTILLRTPGVRPIGIGFIVPVLISMASAFAAGALSALVLPWFAAALISVVTYGAAVHFLRITGPAGLRSLLDEF